MLKLPKNDTFTNFEIVNESNEPPKEITNIAIYFNTLILTYLLCSETKSIKKLIIAAHEVANVNPTCRYCLYNKKSNNIFVKIPINDEITGNFLSL